MIAGENVTKHKHVWPVLWPPVIGLLAAGASGHGGTMHLTSPVFAQGAGIPAKFTCDGQNMSPPLKWEGVPAEAKSLALVVDDPDAPGGLWVHWVLFDLPPTTTDLPEDMPKTQYVLRSGKQGLNDFKHLGYGGPCPPAGKAHRYFFKIYALDRTLDLKPGVTKKQVEQEIEKHTLAQGELMGTYKRK